jgi:hypothetical protein
VLQLAVLPGRSVGVVPGSAGCDGGARKVGRTVEAARQATSFGILVIALTGDVSGQLAPAADRVPPIDVPTNVEEWAHEEYFITGPDDPVVVIAPAGAARDRARERAADLSSHSGRLSDAGRCARSVDSGWVLGAAGPGCTG